MRSAALAVGLVGAILFVLGYRTATAPPVVRRLVMTIPASVPFERLRVVLVSDIHAHGPDMPPRRVRALVAAVNRLRPDVVLLAGDFIGNNAFGRSYTPEEAIAPLGGLTPRLGSYAVLGNNDRIAGAGGVTDALRRARIRVLDRDAVEIGPLALGGLPPRGRDPEDTSVAVRETVAAMARLPGTGLLLAHEPDYFPHVPQSVPLLLAGHTHCGQIALPFVGAVITGSDYGRRYRCGLVRERGHSLIVGAGVGTSHIPIRLFAPADFWVVDFVPSRPKPL
jgi:predicted MPP superfamily phosphohydrolase